MPQAFVESEHRRGAHGRFVDMHKRLVAMGATWDQGKQAWNVPAEHRHELEALLSDLGMEEHDEPAPEAKPAGESAARPGYEFEPDDVFRTGGDPIPAPDGWNLTDREIESVAKYTRGAYGPVNENLRDGTPQKPAGDQLVADLDSVIAKAGELPEPRVVYRGVSIPWWEGMPRELDLALLDREARMDRISESFADWTEGQFQEGDELELPAFQSTSTDVSAPLNAATGKTTPGLMFEILAHNGAPLTALSGETGSFDDEAELLLPRNSRFRVRHVIRRVEFVQDLDHSSWRTVVQLEQL